MKINAIFRLLPLLGFATLGFLACSRLNLPPAQANPAGESRQLHFSGTTPDGAYLAWVDSLDQVVESDEGNNHRQYQAPTPTPPPLCTSDQSPDSSLFQPMFSAPETWIQYQSPDLEYEIAYPPDAQVQVQGSMLEIRLPFKTGTSLEVKSLILDVRPVVPETCYGGVEWQGSVSINGMDYRYRQGELWEQDPSGLLFYRSDFATLQNGLCYRVAVRMAQRASSGTSQPALESNDLDTEMFLNILSTFRLAVLFLCLSSAS